MGAGRHVALRCHGPRAPCRKTHNLRPANSSVPLAMKPMKLLAPLLLLATLGEGAPGQAERAEPAPSAPLAPRLCR